MIRQASLSMRPVIAKVKCIHTHIFNLKTKQEIKLHSSSIWNDTVVLLQFLCQSCITLNILKFTYLFSACFLGQVGWINRLYYLVLTRLKNITIKKR